MSSKVLTLMPLFVQKARARRSEDVIDMTPVSDNDLEWLAKTIDVVRSRKVIADGDLIKAQNRATEAAADLNEAVDNYEAEVLRRGLLCRK